ncbi:MAG: sigma-54-dependent Fis family transcriptional regulator [Gemmatimonadetes bacterium]|nr:sigma-54-dependent Fis family transcriptional regulator [Gemmatimonadota bacterium]
MEKIRIILVNFSESFAQVWDGLARDLGVEWEQLEGRDPDAAGPDVAAFLLAAGGAEGDVVDWLDNHQPPAGVPTFAIGSDTGRRMATHIVSAGASDYFALPEDLEILRNSVAAAVERRRVAMRRMVQQRGETKNDAFASIIGESPAIKKVLARAARILQRADATILIDGETGTGKELVARGIHDGGPRRGAPFVAVNCAALSPGVLESELFVHGRGSFTGAVQSHAGLFEDFDRLDLQSTTAVGAVQRVRMVSQFDGFLIQLFVRHAFGHVDLENQLTGGGGRGIDIARAIR